MLVVYVIMVQYSTTSLLSQLPSFRLFGKRVGFTGGEETDPESDRFGVDQP